MSNQSSHYDKYSDFISKNYTVTLMVKKWKKIQDEDAILTVTLLILLFTAYLLYRLWSSLHGTYKEENFLKGEILAKRHRKRFRRGLSRQKSRDSKFVF